MAVINIKLDVENATPVNGVFTFTTKFLNATTGELLTDPKLPQNQVHTTNSLPDGYELPVTIADGVYNITNTKLNILYKDKIIEYVMPTTSVNCALDCSVFPIVSVTQNSNSSFNVTLSSSGTNSFAWKIVKSSSPNVTVASGTANTTTASFNITTPTLTAGSYLLELVGNTCKGKEIKSFTVTGSGTSPCQQGPTLLAVLSATPTGLQFQFDGLGVTSITWRIKQGSNVPRSGVVSPTNSTPSISYASLPNGNYTLEIEGNSCSSLPSSIGFSVNSGTEVPLAFITGSPSVTGSAGNYSMSIAINKSGAYNTIILNTTTGVYYQNGNITYVANTPYVKTGLPVGTYLVRVGSLETSLVIQNTGSSPCTRGPSLIAIQEVGKTFVKFLFDGENVTAITWRVKSGSSTARSGVVYPTNNTPTVTFSEIANGSYTFEIEGNNCSSPVSSNSFTIEDTPSGDNAGVVVTETFNKIIRVINGKDFTASVNSTTGAIKLNYDELSVANQGGKQVKAWLMSGEQVEIKGADLAGLRSANGIVLPPGNYHFYLYYAATDLASTFADLKTNMWTLFLNPATWPLNSKTLEEVIIEVRTKQISLA